MSVLYFGQSTVQETLLRKTKPFAEYAAFMGATNQTLCTLPVIPCNPSIASIRHFLIAIFDNSYQKA
jgi:hypothetical protein